MNAERRIQRIRKAIEPVGHSRSDWEIICAIAKAMGKGESFSYGSAEDIWNEIRSVWPAGRGIIMNGWTVVVCSGLVQTMVILELK